jgi:hypothetical protein
LQPEQSGSLAAPRADDFFSFAVVIRPGVVLFCGSGTFLLRDTNHASILPYHEFVNEALTITL